MKRVIELRQKIQKTSNLELLKGFEVDVINYKATCIFSDVAKSVDALLEDVQEKIYYLENEEEINKSRVIKELENPLVESCDQIVEGSNFKVGEIVQSDNCLLIIHDKCSIREIEREAIRITLQKNNENRTKSAIDLGISIRTLRNKINEYIQNGEII